ncbi:MAG: diacylglycerol kinase [Armatimonadetes bacterium]|nr:diacylglycerol kinase [Armatimonadota bacterium]
MRIKNPLNGFKYAMEGVAHVFRTQRHMRFHFLVLFLVLLVSLVSNRNRTEVLVLLFTVTLVLMAEMFNTAVEALVDLVTQTYHPLAKFAKDIAAGAVLITVMNAFVVGFLLFFGGSEWPDITGPLGLREPKWPTVAAVGFILLAVLVTMGKVRGGRGKLWKGGVVSAHSAIGFFLCVTILYVSRSIAAAALAFAMAALIAQSRVEAKIHTVMEVVTGAIIAVALSVAVYWFIVPP